MEYKWSVNILVNFGTIHWQFWLNLNEFNKNYGASYEQKWNNCEKIATQKENCHIGIAWEHNFQSIMNFLYKKLCPIIWAISSPRVCCMCLCGHESRTDNMRKNEMILHARCPLFPWTFTMIWCDVTQFIETTTKAHHTYMQTLILCTKKGREKGEKEPS